MTLTIQADQTAFSRIKGLRIIVCTAHSLPCDVECQDFLASCWKEGRASVLSLPTVQSHPLLQSWRACFQSLGISVKRFVPSVESLLKRAAKDPVPRSISPLVDFYNGLSVKWVVPFGGFDLNALPPGCRMDLRETRPGDTFQALDEEEPAPLPPGEMAYLVGNEVVTRHINYRQSRLGLITKDTRSVVLMAEVLSDVPEDVLSGLQADLKTKFREIFGADASLELITAENPVCIV